MKDSIKNRKKKLLALCLSAMMLSSATAFAACSDGSTDSSSSSSSSSEVSQEKDTGLIKNADFEISSKNLINDSVTNWSRSNTSDSNGKAPSSTAKSGIVDLNEDAWKNLTTSVYKATNATDAKANWSKMTTKDKLDFYKTWKNENSGKTISTELDFYESFNIDEGDTFNLAHFDTHDNEVAAQKGGKEDADTRVLMIHNQNPELSTKTTGTGQQYTSSSTVTVKAGTSAKFSVWVKTSDLKSADTNGATQDAVGKGAFISVTHSVGGTTLDEYKVENINTEAMGVTDNNGWKQYVFRLQGASYTDSTFSLVLGLGQGGSEDYSEYVNGFAFFDDIECEIIENETFTPDAPAATLTSTAEEKIVDASKHPEYSKFMMNFYGEFDGFDNALSSVVYTATANDNGETSKEGDAPASWLGGGITGANDIQTVLSNVKADSFTSANATAKAHYDTVYNKYFKDDAKFENDKTLLLLSENGVAYTAKADNVYTVDAGKYAAISFFVKTSEMEGKTGAGITLISDDGTETSFASIDTTTATPVTINDEDIHDGWQQYFFFVKNDTDKSATLDLTFNFGPTDINADLTKDSFFRGFAAFTHFEIDTEMEKEEYDSVKDGSNAKLHLITEDEENASSASGFDTAMGTPSNALKVGLANPKNYKGVYMNNQLITGVVTDSNAINAYENAGLISKEYFGDYFATSSAAWLTSIKGASTSAEEVWANVFGNDSSLPLFIWNNAEAAAAKPYGFLGSKTTISANSYVAVSVRVKGTGANAYIRLVDTNDDNYEKLTAYNQIHSIGGNLTYWYDDDGNLYDGDPSEATSKLAFRLQPNGLYKANKNWKGYADLTDAQKNAYFANLNAYKADKDGNLVVAANGASHDYTGKFDGEGLDGIAFYKKGDKFYADRAKTVEVLDLKTVAGLAHRYEAVDAAEQTLEATIAPKADKWTTVTFYIHTGDVAKNYRLEVFSGSKDTANADGTYVIFDTTNVGTAETNFNNLLGDEDYVAAASKKTESVFSYFDANTYLRYDSTLDSNEIGNLYEDNYTASAQESGISYLVYGEENDLGVVHTVFADYAYTEKTVTASEKDDDTSDSSSSDDETENDMNVWLLVSSLAVAGVLVLAIVSIVARKMIAKARKKRTAQNSPKAKK